MIVYGHHAYRLDVPRFVIDLGSRLEKFPRAPERDAIVDLLVDLGEACSALIDAACPTRDDDVDWLRPWSEAIRGVAIALVASVDGDGDGVNRGIDAARRAAASLDAAVDMRQVPARIAEGFAHYSVYPEQYIVAADRFVAACRPRAVACIGIRTIGVPLAHVAAAAMERRGVDAAVFTVRPRGHPFDRHLAMTDRLRRRIRESNPTHYVAVDEGPGISGSSFAAASEGLLTLGTNASSIVLFPSWSASETMLCSRRGRDAWRRHTRFTASFEEAFGPDPRGDISAGAWRRHVFGPRVHLWPAVQPQHERRKYLSHTGSRTSVSRFAGLGRHGRAKLQRAEAIHDARFGPKPVTLANGFITLEWIDGVPRAAGDADAALLDRLASYVTFVLRAFRTGRRAEVSDLAEMLRLNAMEALGADFEGPVAALAEDGRDLDEPEIAVDGRLLPHEWVSSGAAAFKVDALDHHADDFLPCSRDIAWDVAGTIVEFGFDAARRAQFIARYRARSGDRTIDHRLRFYEAAYLAYRMGYATLAADAVGATPDAARFAALKARYRRSLAALALPRRSAQRR